VQLETLRVRHFYGKILTGELITGAGKLEIVAIP
jgi:hypothetical protein